MCVRDDHSTLYGCLGSVIKHWYTPYVFLFCVDSIRFMPCRLKCVAIWGGGGGGGGMYNMMSVIAQ